MGWLRGVSGSYSAGLLVLAGALDLRGGAGDVAATAEEPGRKANEPRRAVIAA